MIKAKGEEEEDIGKGRVKREKGLREEDTYGEGGKLEEREMKATNKAKGEKEDIM